MPIPPPMLSGRPWPRRPLLTLAPSPCFVYMLFRSLGIAGAAPVVEYMLFRSTPSLAPLECTPGTAPSTLELRTLSGRLSRLPPQRDDGASALTDASVSIDLRLRRLLDEARVRIEALSVSRLLAVAVVYVVGLLGGAKCAGIADAGGCVANGWLNCIDWPFEPLALFCDVCVLLLGPMDCIVVKVVVKEPTEGAGLEKVLSPPRLDSTPPPTVRLVPVTELAPWLGALMDRAVSFSVERVPAMLLPPVVGGAKSSTEYRPK